MEPEDLAKRIRDACLQAVLPAYEDAGVLGLCAEGRWEAALGALKTVELAPLLREFKPPSANSKNPTSTKKTASKKRDNNITPIGTS